MLLIFSVCQILLDKQDHVLKLEYIEEHGIDVFVIKNSTDVPYYLIENYTDKNYKPTPPKKGKTVQAYHIYTRVMDNNTTID